MSEGYIVWWIGPRARVHDNPLPMACAYRLVTLLRRARPDEHFLVMNKDNVL
jgi:hypothetical protein